MFGTPRYLTKALCAFPSSANVAGQGRKLRETRKGYQADLTTHHKRKAKRGGLSIFKLSASDESARAGASHARYLKEVKASFSKLPASAFHLRTLAARIKPLG
jgi:hypothetical protein